ncbi:deoxyribodipyrimidine photo-lyase [Pseudomonas sp. WN033]|nr:deoxyribodipyrimidine photo-lyase [Pseudomonas sp. WN033]
MTAIQLCWLRNDLRCTDNQALWHASQQGPVVAVWLISGDTWKAHDDAPVKIDFWLRNLRELGLSLATLNIPLRIIDVGTWSHCAEALLELASQLNAQGLFFNDEYGIHEQARDAEVERTFQHAGLDCRRFTDQLLFAPTSLKTQAGTPFKVFSQFRRQAYAQLHSHLPECLPAPQRQSALPLTSDTPPAQLDDFSAASPLQQQLWPAGEAAAQQRLEQFCHDALMDYHVTRDRPDLQGTSQLSPYLASGILSVRQCLHAALRANQGEFASGSPGAVAWINELLWREFYKYILVNFPQVSRHRAFRPATEAIPWRNDPAALEAWQQGRTGFPIIDAAMRQLATTGWMHNRLRMLCAMFLSKNLLLDWRSGERWFMRQLIDGDLAANNGGWQWSASTGTDAAPYFRLFNPISQARKFDPQGDFIRQWVSELTNTPTVSIHAPQPDSLLKDNDYPAPIIDLASSRERALTAFRELASP